MLDGDETEVNLPSMEILGFYDEPYRVHVERPLPPRPVAHHPAGPAVAQTPRDTSKSLVASLWESIDLGDSLLDWAPSVIARRKLAGRSFSTTVVVAALLASAVLSAILWFATQRGPALEAEASTAFGTALIQSTQVTDGLIDVVTTLGSPQAPDLADATAAILAAESGARDLFSAAGRLDESDPRRSVAVAATTTILDATSRTSRLLAYRFAAAQMLTQPSLPTGADTELAAATEKVAAWRADVQAAMDELPSSTMGAHRRAVQAWVGELEAWQGRYLDAVREGDTVAMASALTAQASRIDDLHQDMLLRLGRGGTSLARDLGPVVADLERLLGP